MLKREYLEKEILDKLGILEYSIRNRGLNNLLDQHIIAESFFAEMLNVLFGYNLINLNVMSRNNPGIDLGDVSHKTAIQVTSTKTHKKIQQTIDTFIHHNLHQQYTQLYILILGEKQKSYRKPFNTQGVITFDPETHIIDLREIVQKISSLTISELQTLGTLMRQEFQLSDSGAGNAEKEETKTSNVIFVDFNQKQTEQHQHITTFNAPVSNTIVGNNNQITIQKETTKNKYPKGCIGFDVLKANYVGYLIERYQKYKEYEVGKGSMNYKIFPSQLKKRFKIGTTRSIYHIPLTRFEELVTVITTKIDGTKLAKIKKGKGQLKNYETFEEYRKQAQ